MYSVPANQTKLPAPIALKLIGVRYGLGSLLLGFITSVSVYRLLPWFGSISLITLLKLGLYFVMAVLYAIMTWGIFKQRERIRRLGVGLESVSVVVLGLTLFIESFDLSDWLSLGLSVVIIWYLRRSATLDYFY
ncbi:hypothetical protein SE18_09945 [Herpetosiphon geysericola]|uniref:Uncharacterized protein n=2 Tax=Herpetosiphon geysericola TaxID=70996 RepID=A0A0P6YB83_9CHLR|nr:hypothetical protein SE18_09945 [Herpetosiphon geysericola]